MNKNNQILMSVLATVMLLISMTGLSYAFFTYSAGGSTINTITTGTISFAYSEQSNGISLTNAFPMSDTEGKILAANTPSNGVTQGYFDFTVSGTVAGVTDVNYEIYAKSDATSTIAPSFIKVYLTNGSGETPIVGFSGAVPTFDLLRTSTMDVNGKTLYNGTINNKSITQTFRLRIWIADNYTINAESKTFKMKVYVQATA